MDFEVILVLIGGLVLVFISYKIVVKITPASGNGVKYISPRAIGCLAFMFLAIILAILLGNGVR